MSTDYEIKNLSKDSEVTNNRKQNGQHVYFLKILIPSFQDFRISKTLFRVSSFNLILELSFRCFMFYSNNWSLLPLHILSQQLKSQCLNTQWHHIEASSWWSQPEDHHKVLPLLNSGLNSILWSSRMIIYGNFKYGIQREVLELVQNFC